MGNLDRRSFLKGGVVAAGAAAFAGALSVLRAVGAAGDRRR